MNSIISLVAVIFGLVLMLNVTSSWGQPVCSSPGCNATETDAKGNTAGGTGALLNVDQTDDCNFEDLCLGSGNTAFGTGALGSNTTGSQNSAMGARALGGGPLGLLATTGNFNTASGFEALLYNTTGSWNTASGHDALWFNHTGSFNTANGSNALASNTAGSYNTATGTFALHQNITGADNTAIGYRALYNNFTGFANIASGNDTLFSNSTGIKNTALGTNALFYSTGNKNIAIGFRAGFNLTTGNNNIYIGNQGGGDESQTIRIGTAQARTFIAGITDAGVSNAATVMIDTTTGQLGLVESSARYKQNIVPMGTRSEKMLDLRPVTFAYKHDAHGVTHYGLIAEEVATVYPELVTHTATGEVQTVKYQELIPMLLNELQRQRQELAELRALVGQGRETASLAR